MYKLSPAEKDYICQGLKANVRNDGRSTLDLREIWLQTQTLKQANGSCTLNISDSPVKIYVGIKLEIGSPNPQTPESGIIKLTIESLHRISAIDESTKEDQQNLHNEVKGILLEHYIEHINKKKLGIIPEKKCWIVYVDIFVLGMLDKSYIDQIALGIKAAFYDLTIPQVFPVHNQLTGEWEIELKDEHISIFEKLEMNNFPTMSTIGQLENVLVVDMTPEEYHSVDSQYLITFDDVNSQILGIHKTGEGSTPPEMIFKIISLAEKAAFTLNNNLKKLL